MYKSSSLRMLLILLAFIVSSYHVKSQTKIPFLSVSEMKVADTFDYLQSFLIEKDYFVQAMDSKRAFVQISILPNDKGIFKRPRRLTVNFFVVANGSADSQIRLQIKEEVLMWEGRGDHSSYYYKDEGILKAEDKTYDDIIAELKAYYDGV